VSAFDAALRSAFGAERVGTHVPLAAFTTFKVGGPAEWFVETRSSDDIVIALALARAAGVRVTILGGGSNVLVADAGVRGLVIRPRGGDIARVDDTRVRADAAVTINGLVRWTINHAAAGLEAWAGTPGTVGGAIFGNAHFNGKLIGDLVVETRLVSAEGAVVDVPAASMAFGYDRSRLQSSAEILLSAVFRVAAGEPAALRATARASLAYRKKTQPLDTPSAGCIFQNPEPGRDRVPDGIPWSAGALVDRAGLKGAAVGGARVSPTHGNFIVNEGSATAADIKRLIDQCRAAVRDRFGVALRDEIVYLGDWNSGFGIRDSGFGTRDSGFGTRDSGFGIRDSRDS
jgi:UDP-N-acetylmuramate dehydrogenase